MNKRTITFFSVLICVLTLLCSCGKTGEQKPDVSYEAFEKKITERTWDDSVIFWDMDTKEWDRFLKAADKNGAVVGRTSGDAYVWTMKETEDGRCYYIRQFSDGSWMSEYRVAYQNENFSEDQRILYAVGKSDIVDDRVYKRLHSGDDPFFKVPPKLAKASHDWEIYIDGKTVGIKGKLDSYKEIGSGRVFTEMKTHLEIPEKISGLDVTSIEDEAFRDFGEWILEVKFPDTVTHIGWGAFSDCRRLHDVVLPQNLETIEADAFRNCVSISSMVIPASVKDLDSHAFSGCDLDRIRVSEGSQTYRAGRGDAVIRLSDGVLIIGTNKTRIPSDGTVTKIGDEAFRDLTKLTTIRIPEGVTEIGRSAFESCENLKTVVLPSTLKKIGQDAFLRCSNLSSINIPEGAELVGNPFVGTKVDPEKQQH